MAIGIVMHNNERNNAQDLFVSVNDLNLANGPTILVNQRINVDQTFPLNVQDDQNGNGNIMWTAQTVDGSATNNATVSVTDGADGRGRKLVTSVFVRRASEAVISGSHSCAVKTGQHFATAVESSIILRQKPHFVGK